MSTDFCKGKRQALPKCEVPAQGHGYEIKREKLRDWKKISHHNSEFDRGNLAF